jgi:hypothetical protein
MHGSWWELQRMSTLHFPYGSGVALQSCISFEKTMILSRRFNHACHLKRPWFWADWRKM